MGTFSTNLKLGDTAYGVEGWLDPRVITLTVGQVRIYETHPKATRYNDDPCYKEEYMCFETGVGSGTLWQYGKNIFATEADAKRGVIEHQQSAHEQIAIRDAERAENEARQREQELATLQRLKTKYADAK